MLLGHNLNLKGCLQSIFEENEIIRNVSSQMQWCQFIKSEKENDGKFHLINMRKDSFITTRLLQQQKILDNTRLSKIKMIKITPTILTYTLSQTNGETEELIFQIN